MVSKCVHLRWMTDSSIVTLLKEYQKSNYFGYPFRRSHISMKKQKGTLSSDHPPWYSLSTSQQRSPEPVSLLVDWTLPSNLIWKDQIWAITETTSIIGHSSSWGMSHSQTGESLSKLWQFLSLIVQILSEYYSIVWLCLMLSEVSRSILCLAATKSMHACAEHRLVYFLSQFY